MRAGLARFFLPPLFFLVTMQTQHRKPEYRLHQLKCLVSKHHFTLQVFPDGTVNGTLSRLSSTTPQFYRRETFKAIENRRKDRPNRASPDVVRGSMYLPAITGQKRGVDTSPGYYRLDRRY
ncbi:unnamed protein product [Darwinula stevensoni]|uniref:Uncharacterized protein n=1 Tax=Darwinula stevensoni TaxID=69355 RepID=A0A7R9FSF9_9CRUS|nr:unnamed protein product [Darwinula stevensoni]CAG0903402.1 unnamed protein product [Darwinula stevensoni]